MRSIVSTIAIATAIALPLSANAAAQRRVVSPLKHIVVVIQENRTTDNLFNGFCIGQVVCADTVTVDPVTQTPLLPVSLAASFGLNHDHPTFVTQYDGGKMDGFPLTPIHCKGSVRDCGSAFSYVPAAETPVYRAMATVDGELSDATFETDEGPSFPAHLYSIAGQSGGYDDDHWAIAGGSGNCASNKVVTQILMTSPYPGQEGNKVLPCKDFQTIFDLLALRNHTWRYYSNVAGGWWSPTEAIQHLFKSPNFIIPSTRFLTDVRQGSLADVTFIVPFNAKVSDHPSEVDNALAGQAWVGSIIDSIGMSPYWNSTAIVVYWDDWGGWFDHVSPPASPFQADPFEYGFRVPLVVVSPYARLGRIDHTPRTFVSALNLIEETFGLPSLGTVDQYEPDGLDSMLNLAQKPNRYFPLVTGAGMRRLMDVPTLVPRLHD